jgi:serine/threonine protein kinase/Tol biopolymer transport system component
MTPERWQQVRGILESAMELRPSERAAFLDRECADDPSLREDVDKLLSAEAKVEQGFLESPAAEQVARASTTNSTILALGTRLGPYEVQALLGTGGMGEVYRARDTRLNRTVAIKVLPRSLSSDPFRRKRFEREAVAISTLQHPNICTLFDVGHQDETDYLVMEYLEGGTLAARLRKGRLPLDLTLRHATEVADALDAAHRHGIVHRDLKPANIFLTAHGEAKVLDFGLAKVQERSSGPRTSAETAAQVEILTTPGVAMGTAPYMSPEQARGEDLDSRTDIFSLGAVLYEMATGKMAFSGKTTAMVHKAILDETPLPPSQLERSLPLRLDQVIEKALEKDRDLRYQSAADLRADLNRLKRDASSGRTAVKGPDSNSRIDSVTVGGTARSRKKRLVASALLIFSAALLALLLLLEWKRRSSALRVESIVQITNDGYPKPLPSFIVSDGSRLYFQEIRSGLSGIAQTSITGGQTVPVISTLVNPELLDISPDSSALLIRYGTFGNTFIATLPLPSGQPRTLAKASTAAFLPDGQRIVYCDGKSLYIAQIDGTVELKIPDVADCAQTWLSVSPDGRRVRFAISNSYDLEQWEVRADETHPHPQQVPSTEGVAKGSWTADEKFFIVGRWENGPINLWALPEKHGILSRSSGEPIRLTNGPLSYGAPLLSRDGKKIFAIGYQNRGELIRYDSASKQFMPFLNGISATDVIYSLDRQWLIYVSYPGHDLWRCRADGTNCVQMTYPPILVYLPDISPDGNKVGFLAMDPKRRNWGTYVMDTAGGKPRFIIGGQNLTGWSFDSTALLVNIPTPTKNSTNADSMQLASIDIESGKISIIPNSEGKGGAVQPTEQMIIASGEQDRLYWFDRSTEKWSVLAEGPIQAYTMSPDLKYLYFVREQPDNAQAMRIRLADRKIENIASLKGVRRLTEPAQGEYSWVGVSQDGSLLLTRDTGTQEIYALNLHQP